MVNCFSGCHIFTSLMFISAGSLLVVSEGGVFDLVFLP